MIHPRMSREAIPHFVAYSDRDARLCETMASHCDAGAEMGTLTGFPNEVVTAVRYHHEPQRLLDLTGAEAKSLTMVTVS